jgi:hypothetical protein
VLDRARRDALGRVAVSRSFDERARNVGRLLAAARAVYDDRTRYTDALVRATGLSPEGVELGFQSLERDASEKELSSLISSAGDAERVHVILSANVFVAPLRAIALARAAAPVVTVRASPRDPVLTRALVEAVSDPGLALVAERDVGALEAGEIHVYGSDDTIAAVRAEARTGVVVRGHGAGMGAGVVTAGADLEIAAEAMAADVVVFDQRGCLSPRLAVVEGGEARAMSFARAMHGSLERWEARVPRGALFDEERRAGAYWRETMAFVGERFARDAHVVALVPQLSLPSIPPPGRHLVVAHSCSLEAAFAALAPVARHIVAIGTDDPARALPLAPAHARLARLGRMQHPPLDGPVDRRPG